MIADISGLPLDDPLSQLQWRVARRADEIARARTLAAPLNLHCWLVAETEVWTEFSRRGDAATSLPTSPRGAKPDTTNPRAPAEENVPTPARFVVREPSARSRSP